MVALSGTGWASLQRTCNLVAKLLLNDGQLTAFKQEFQGYHGG